MLIELHFQTAKASAKVFLTCSYRLHHKAHAYEGQTEVAPAILSLAFPNFYTLAFLLVCGHYPKTKMFIFIHVIHIYAYIYSHLYIKCSILAKQATPVKGIFRYLCP